MEVLPCSSVQYAGESDAQQTSVTDSINNGDSSNYFQRENQVQTANSSMNNLILNVEGPQSGTHGEEGQRMANQMPVSEERNSGASDSDFEDDDLFARNCFVGNGQASENSNLVVDTIESELANDVKEGDSSLPEPKWPEHDECAAVWVKWRGQWQAGIRCARADWPLTTLKAKPTHERKKYFVIFFPHTRNYSWVDTLLVRPINEFPQPLAHKTHKVGLKVVKDLTVACRYIMRKLTVGMLNIIEQLHSQALIEASHNLVAWKECAMVASRCLAYSDFGKMLLKLQSMILERYINSEWLRNSFPAWAQRCQNAHSAELVELLKEELRENIMLNEVNSLREAQMRPMLGSEWRTWKHEVLKLFSMSKHVSNGGKLEQQSSNGPSTVDLQVSRKRPKLEVRRAESHASQVETSDPNTPLAVAIGSEFFNSQDTVREDNALSSVADKWGGVVVAAVKPEEMQIKPVELTPVNGGVKEPINPPSQNMALTPFTPSNEGMIKRSMESGNRSRQCIAYIESKGRQCVRWANEGDMFCCVHLASRFVSTTPKAEGTTASVDQPMCGGTTVLGTKCKHRALVGSLFCKKHRPKNDAENISNTPVVMHKRNYEEMVTSSDTSNCRDLVLVREESPLQVDPVSVMRSGSFIGNNSLVKYNNANEGQHCIGSYTGDDFSHCSENPTRFSLYCDNHLPSWLKRARNGKTRIVSKDVFMDLLKHCSSLQQKLHLHRACELFYKLLKSIMSLRNPVPMDIQLQWAISEASKDFSVGQFLMKLVCSEKERLCRIWGFSVDENAGVSSVMEASSSLPPSAVDQTNENGNLSKCKVCSREFLDDQELNTHWMDNHKKEAQWLFRGYACAICLDSFTNKKVLESHVQERHHVGFVEQCMLLQCIPCGSHFGNNDELWMHVVSVHPHEFRISKPGQEQHNLPAVEGSSLRVEAGNSSQKENHSENVGTFRRFICRFCGLKFDLLPDLGRHHQAAHMGQNLVSTRPQKKGVRYYPYKSKSGRLSHPRFKKGLAAVSYRIRNRGAANMKKRIQAAKSVSMEAKTETQPQVTETSTLGRLADSQCSAVSKILFSEIQKTKPRPSNQEILSMARLACCKISLKASMEEQYGVLPERLYLKAAKLCSEHDVQVDWHQEGFVCPNGCKFIKDPNLLSPLLPCVNGFVGQWYAVSSDHGNNEWKVDECHFVIGSHHLGSNPSQKATVLCSDISSGKELVPIACVVDEGLLDSINIDSGGSDKSSCCRPWESFNYTQKLLLDSSLDLDAENSQLGCACPPLMCFPETCDHVYLFDNDYEDAKDIYGKPMRGRFPYDRNGRIIVEEGYMVYECNHMCRCSKACPNRVLQNGMRVKLEVFKTENKGWAVRAGEPILRGTFICEYVGEVIDEQEANKRRSRYGKEGCGYMFKVDAHINDMGRMIEGQIPYVIDSTKYGNVSRFINHSCLPNLVTHQVLIESMDCQRAHIGLYASRDISSGEELTYDYHCELLPGEGRPCHCGASKCRGCLY